MCFQSVGSQHGETMHERPATENALLLDTTSYKLNYLSSKLMVDFLVETTDSPTMNKRLLRVQKER